MKNSIVAIVIVLLLCWALAPAAGQQDSPPGSIKLLPGYQHKTLQGIDTSVGKIWKDGGIEIQYDIGRLAGDYANPKYPERYVWHREQSIGGRRVHSALDKRNTLIVSFPDTSANFMAEVKSHEDIVDMLLMVLTYEPDSRAR